MGTLIKSIAFQNFYNYFGNYKDNTYTFTEGINIINADNNMGKSKFYNGFLWILDDKVYDSDEKKYMPVSESYWKMTSIKAKRENTKYEMGVEVVFENGGITYTIKKYVLFALDNNGEWTSKPVCDVSKLVENRNEPILGENDIQDVIRKLIPADMEKYSLLQGESMERLVDLSSREGLGSTINALADISNLIKMEELAGRLAGLAKKEKETIEKKAAKADEEITAKLKDRDDLESWIEGAQEQIKLAQDEIAEATQTKEQFEADFYSSKERIKRRKEYDDEDAKLVELRKERDEAELSITSRLFDENCPWLLWGLRDEIQIFDDLRVDFISKKKEAEIIKNPDILLPEGSPDVPSLQRMLRTHKCEVCGRDAFEGTPEYMHIKMILERPKKAMALSNNTLSQLYSELQTNVGSYARSIDELPDEYDKFRDHIEELITQIEEQEKVVELKFNELALLGMEDNNPATDAAILSKYNQAKNTISTKTEEISTLTNRISVWEKRREKLIEELNSRQTSDEVTKATNFYELMVKISNLYRHTKDSVFEDIVAKLEQSANEMYESLTQGNQTLGGRIIFRKQDNGSIRVSVVNAMGEELTGNGTGFQRMKQLAIVMSIISSKLDHTQFDYPFISDAPFSEFSVNFINNFFNIAPGIFRQSIIMIKDLYDVSAPNNITLYGEKIVDRMKKGEMKGTFYVNFIDDKSDNSNLVTSKKCYTA